MAQAIDPQWLGQRLKEVRTNRKRTLKEASEETGLSIATLSRIERGDVESLKGDTLLTICDWLGIDARVATKTPPPPRRRRSEPESLPEIVDLHLRADKHLDPKTADALSRLFRSLYENARELDGE